ncbi:hypothetical protein [Streptomyces laurentii]|uniref:hypothetical protein n=1 Tax=Streptomyces laurentii TaxID=39478 RepID=UPI0036BC668A
MNDQAELSLRWEGKAARWWTAAALLFAVGAGVAAGLGAPWAQKWAIAAGLVGTAAVSGMIGMFRRRVEAGPDGLRFRAVLGWRRLEWDEIVRFEDLRVDSAGDRLRTSNLRVAAMLRDGSVVSLPLPWVGAESARDFEQQLSQLRALHRRYRHSTVGA